LSLRLSTNQLLAALAGVRTLTTVIQEETPLGPTDAALVEVAIRDLAPEPDWPYWLFALAPAQGRAVEVLETWLDSDQLEDEAREYITMILGQVLERGAGTPLTEQRFEQLVADAFGRTVETVGGDACGRGVGSRSRPWLGGIDGRRCASVLGAGGRPRTAGSGVAKGGDLRHLGHRLAVHAVEEPQASSVGHAGRAGPDHDGGGAV
jgi:hypothetical protein